MADGLTIRPEDQRLAEACLATATAAGEAVAWLGDNLPDSVGVKALQKRLRKQSVEARQLAAAAARPLSVGVFGVSQAGKSFLIGKLIKPSGRAAAVVFGRGAAEVRQDFLEQINPEGGDETTGLVTRFTLRRFETPEGYPVVLRLLREVDIVKVLANTFRFDLKGQYRLRTGPKESDIDDRTPTPERIRALVDLLAGARRPRPEPGFAVEDVYELRDYVERKLDDHVLAGPDAEAYWMFLEEALPRLDAHGRAKALAPLWAGLEEFEGFYLCLKSALDQLGHPFRIYAQLEALRDRRHGVLHVETLYELNRPTAERTLVVAGERGQTVRLPIAVVTALTAELSVSLERAPWDFFRHTDLLDFPGARARENSTVHEFLRNPEKPNAAGHCFRRGKVAVLFDNYAAELDLNAMLLCVGPENDEVKTLPDLIQDWIGRTHGDTPPKRQQANTALFFCLTKADTLFVRRVGSENPVAKRFANNLAPFGDWIREWIPGRPFDNTFLIRSTGIHSPALFTYDPMPPDGTLAHVPPERALTTEFGRLLEQEIRPKFLDEPLVRRHVADPSVKLEAVLAINDGGTSLLAAAIAPVCNPDLKSRQIRPRAQEIAQAVRGDLAHYYESGDVETRITERVVRMRTLCEALKRQPTLIGPFLAAFRVDEPLIEAAYREARRTASTRPADDDLFDGLFGDTDAAAQPTSLGFGQVIAIWWARHLTSCADRFSWCARLGIDTDLLRAFVGELVAGAERLDVARRIEERLDDYTLSMLRLDAATRRVAIHAALLLNGHVNYPGGREAPANRSRFVRVVAPGPGEMVHLPENRRDMLRARWSYANDWLNALQDLARDNAAHGQRGTFDPQQNARLGRILERLGGGAS